MAILVTRPAPDNVRTAVALRERGYDVHLAPMLRMETVAFALDDASTFGGIILTSANAVRALAQHPARTNLIGLPAYAVGEQTAQAARAAGFEKVTVAAGDSAALRDLIAAQTAPRRNAARRLPLLYLAGATPSRDLAGELAAHQIPVIQQTVYRMVPERELPETVRAAFARDAIAAVLHYSADSARAFVEAVRGEGLEISALAVPQMCLSPAIAAVLREAGATRLAVAPQPRETALFGALPPPSSA